MKKTWQLPDLDFQEINTISDSTGVGRNIISILYGRGIKNESDIIQFLFHELNNLHSPFLLHGINQAISRLKTAIDAKEKIAIFGDSDLDGITSLTIIHNLLNKTECSLIIRYPKAKESYGLTCDIIDEFIQEKVTLVITVDSGIRDINEIGYGRKSGIDFIVTDHHEPDLNLPDAIIINPKQKNCSYPFKDLAGVGVAFKFIQAFLYSYTSGFNVNFILVYKNDSFYSIGIIKNGVVEEEIDVSKNNIIAYITTKIKSDDHIILLNNESCCFESIIKSVYPQIAISELKKIAEKLNNEIYENHEILINKLVNEYGIFKNKKSNDFRLYIKLFNELQWRSSKKIMTILQDSVVLFTIGTVADIMPMNGENRHLIKYGLKMINKGQGHVGILSLTGNTRTTSKSISWDIAPLLNAPGRLGKTDLTVKFFLENDSSRLSEILISIQKINKERKKIVSDIIEKINSDKSNTVLDENIFFYMHDEIIDGLAGLIANRLADDFKKPVIVATGSDTNGIVKGSARTYGNYDFFKHTIPISHLFERVGGHAQAFGFTAEFSKIWEIVSEINKSIGNNYVPDDNILIDSIIGLEDINTGFINNLSQLEPYGKGNEEPVFAIKKVKVDSFSSFGTKGNHGKFIIGGNLQAIGWNMYDKMNSYYSSGKSLDIIFKLENNDYLGKIYPRIVLEDIDFSD